MGKRPDIKDFKKVAKAKGGIISAIARTFDVDRWTVYDWCQKYPKYQLAIDEARETFIDIAETNLQKMVNGIPKIEVNPVTGEYFSSGYEKEPSESAVIFTLRTLGRKRGYVEKQDIDVQSGGKPLPAARVLTPRELKELMENIEKEY